MAKISICLLFSIVLLMPVALLADDTYPTFTGTQTGPNEWTYTLMYAPLVNYSIFTPDTTITLTGLYGVTDATGPTSTTFPLPDTWISGINLDWSPAVLDGGTEVVWTHVGPGTGNFGNDIYVYGFTIDASGAVNGTVSLATSGFSRDTNLALPDGTYNLDITGTTDGPVGPVPEPSGLLLLGTGLAGIAGVVRKKLLG
jgi:hypothetical protein